MLQVPHAQRVARRHQQLRGASGRPQRHRRHVHGRVRRRPRRRGGERHGMGWDGRRLAAAAPWPHANSSGLERGVAWRPELPTDGGWGGARQPVDVARLLRCPMAATATLLTRQLLHNHVCFRTWRLCGLIDCSSTNLQCAFHSPIQLHPLQIAEQNEQMLSSGEIVTLRPH